MSTSTNASINDHLPSASSAIKNDSRRLTDSTETGATQLNRHSSSFKYGHPPEKTAMIMASTYT